MRNFILGEKLGMSQWWNEKKEAEPITLIDCSRTVLLGKRLPEKDGYQALIVGIVRKKEAAKERNEKFLKQSRNFSVIKEFPVGEEEKLEVQEGETIKVSIFKPGEVVKAVAISKGKGFQGVVKRHNFGGGPKTHGHRHVLRSGGSIGSAFPEHVQKGKKMAGRMGATQVTQKGSRIAWIDEEKNIFAVRGPVPGKRGNWVKIISTKEN